MDLDFYIFLATAKIQKNVKYILDEAVEKQTKR